jgi:1-acyl-sn-glycerol-3-phosphate acyltransferase
MADACTGASLGNRLLYQIGRWAYRLTGWRQEVFLPDLPKYVLVIAPHTSYFDGLMGFLAEAIVTCGFRTVRISWLGKHTLFMWPLGYLMRWLGGVAVDRRQRNALVGQAVQAFQQRERMTLAITPEGMRKKTRYWKTGFYYIAAGAQVPILLAFIDYKRKLVASGPLITPSGDIEADMEAMRAFFRPVTARHPEKVGEMDIPPRKARPD